jgi:hypothetical protein
MASSPQGGRPYVDDICMGCCFAAASRKPPAAAGAPGPPARCGAGHEALTSPPWCANPRSVEMERGLLNCALEKMLGRMPLSLKAAERICASAWGEGWERGWGGG